MTMFRVTLDVFCGRPKDDQMANKAIIPFLLLLIPLLTACRSQMNTVPTTTPVMVTLYTFSGRPNPKWELNPDEVAALRDILAPLGSTDKAFDTSGWPPYGGFLVEGGNIVASAYELELYNGVISIRDSRHQEVNRLIDPHYRLEEFLFQTGEAYVDVNVYQRALKQFHTLTGQSD